MKIKIPKQFIAELTISILNEAGVENFEDEVENFIYEAGGRDWEEYTNDNGTEFYIFDYDED